LKRQADSMPGKLIVMNLTQNYKGKHSTQLRGERVGLGALYKGSKNQQPELLYRGLP